jgi:predicted transposase/invertase (TIGR01784 family)
VTEPKKHIAKAHDHFFRMAMSDTRVSREFFEAHLPNDLWNIVDLACLELQSGTYIDDMRQESIADMLFKTMMDGHEAYLYLVVDHQSRPDEMMPFRILKYICNIIAQHLKDTDSKRIPLIMPLVVYHGTSVWNYSTNINDLVDAPNNLVETYFLKPFTLIDLNRIDDAVLKEKTWLGVMELTLKHIFAKDMLPYVHDIIELLKRVENADGKNLAEIVLTYILDRSEMSSRDTFIDMVKTGLSPEVGDKIMTLREQFKAEGKIEGKVEGIHLVAANLLKQGSDVAFVAKVTNLSLDEVRHLKDQVKH